MAHLTESEQGKIVQQLFRTLDGQPPAGSSAWPSVVDLPVHDDPVGYRCGPSIVAAFTDFLFQDDAKLGYSLALLFALACPLAALILQLGRGAMRVAVAENMAR